MGVVRGWMGCISAASAALFLFCLLPSATAQTPPLITADSIASGLANPVAITHVGNRLFITEQGGRIRIIDLSTTPPTLLSTPFLDISAIVRAGGEEGLLSVAFDPDYATNGFFYVYYNNSTAYDDGAGNIYDPGSIVIASYTVSSNPNLADATGTVLLAIRHPSFGNHNGGQLHFGRDGFLYAGTGDGGSGNDPPNNAQNRNSLLGKLLRLDVNGPAAYGIPPGNPFANDGDPNTLPEIWAYGLRNPYRFSVDRQTGDIFIGDVGQGAVEEVSFSPAAVGGLNFGWRMMEGFQCTNLGGGPPCNDPSLTLPILEYPNPPTAPSSVVGGYRYRGTRLISPGTYFLADFYSGEISQAREGSPGAWSSSLLLSTGFNVSAFGEDKDGEIYVTNYGGSVYRLNPTDSDSDGLPNWWEFDFFGSTTAAVPSDDTDGDGSNNEQEFTAGTDPRGPASALRITAVEKDGAIISLTFPTVFGKGYQLEFKNDLAAATWTPLGDPVFGTGSPVDVGELAAGDQRFYRARLLP